MAYAALPAKVANDTLTVGNYTTIKGNFEAGVPDIFTTPGDIAVATGADAAARLGVGAAGTILMPDAGEPTGLKWGIQPTCKVYNNAEQATTRFGWRTLTFNTERWDTDGMHSVLANTSRLTVPTDGDGYYLVGGNVTLKTTDLGKNGYYHGLRILLGGASVVAQFGPIQCVANDYDLALAVTVISARSAADYFELQVFTDAPDLVVAMAANHSPEFWAIWQRA